jgi:hypothetical protein
MRGIVSNSVCEPMSPGRASQNIGVDINFEKERGSHTNTNSVIDASNDNDQLEF